MNAEYKKLPDHWLYWCNTHERRATHVMYRPGCRGSVCCDPTLGGIMIPCLCVDLTDIATIEDDEGKPHYFFHRKK